MLPQNKLDFLDTLRIKIEGKLKSSGIQGVAVVTSDKDGSPAVRLCGDPQSVSEARRALKEYRTMIIHGGEISRKSC